MASPTLAMISPGLSRESRPNLTDDQLFPAKIRNFHHITSCNWRDHPVPTIVVPGSPPHPAVHSSTPRHEQINEIIPTTGSPPFWSPPTVRIELQRDFQTGSVEQLQFTAGDVYHPLEPLFRALYVEKPFFQLQDIDIITDRNNVRKLLAFMQESSNEAFRIRVEIVRGRTALFTSVDSATPVTRGGFMGFGRNFEEAFTKRERGSLSHHRIVAYSFDGMNCIVRHETDGYVPTRPLTLIFTVNDVSDAMDPDIITSNDPTATIVEIGGRTMCTSSTLEIKTLARRKTIKMAEVLPQLWISQTPLLVVAYQKYGIFENS